MDTKLSTIAGCTMPNPFYVEPAGNYSAGLAGLGNVLGDYRKEQERKMQIENAQKRMQEVQAALGDAYASGDPNKVAEIAIKYPEAQKTVELLYGFKSDETKKNLLDTGRAVLSNKNNPQAALDAINSRISYLEQSGADPAQSMQMRDQLQSMIQNGEDTSQFFKNAELGYASLASPQEWKAYAGENNAITPYQQAQLDLEKGRLDLEKAKLDFKQSSLAAGGGLDVDTRQKINKDITPLVKETESIYSAAKSLESLEKNASPASQLAAVFKFMKSLDPTSAVRETEQGMVYDAQGAAAGLAGRLNKLLGEGGLTKEGFRDVVSTAKTLANSSIDDKSSEISRYLDVYEGTLPEGFVKSLQSRVPKRFEGADTVKRKDGQIMIDANGNRAMVYPDGTYEEM